MLYLPIKREWLFSRTAQRIYFGCALLTFALVGTELGTHLAISASGIGSLTPSARLLLRRLLLPEILGTALLWVSMWYFWFGFDSSHYVKKAVSFLLLFFLVPVGTLIYYFVTYRQTVRAATSTDHGLKEVCGRLAK
jgi:hypothetical protein